MIDSSEWKSQIVAVIQFILYFYISTFCLGMYIVNVRPLFDVPGCFFFLCYGFIFLVNTMFVIRRLSLPALMFASPMLPLVALISVLTMMPIWQLFKI